MSTGIGCTVYVDGVRLADGSPTDDPLEPNALAGLAVSWGRATTVDQPETSTCTFDVLDEPGGSSFIGLLYTGARITVTATGYTYPDPSVSTFLDPGFEGSGPLALTGSNVAAARSTRRVHSGAQALALSARNAAQRWTAILPPAPFVPTGTDPAAWDAIPTTGSGAGVWSVGAALWIPAGLTVRLRPVLFAGPWATAYTIDDAKAITLTGNGGWQTPAIDYAPRVAGQWIGLVVDAYPTALPWTDVAGSWAAQDPAWTWTDFGTVYVDDVAVLAPAAGTARTVLVFAGRVTDLSVGYDDDAQAPVISVVAADFTADLDNRDVGDEPWPVEAMATRFNRILALSGADVDAIIAARVGALNVSWQDVDAQGAMGLLRELATTVDGVLWSAVHQTTGAYLSVEDPSARQPLFRLELDPDSGLVVIEAAGGRAVSACDILRDGITWQQSVADVSTRTAVTWQEQTTNEEGLPAPTERTVIVVDAPLEAALGVRRMSLSTILQSQADATDVATRLLARTAQQDWRMESATVDDAALDDGSATDLLLTLLDGTSRNGLPIRITDLPAWAPTGDIPVYLEGGTFTFDGGFWVLEMALSRAAGQGQNVVWQDVDPAWTWQEFDPQISWNDLIGVAGPEA